MSKEELLEIKNYCAGIASVLNMDAESITEALYKDDILTPEQCDTINEMFMMD